jgi:archaemetzincin
MLRKENSERAGTKICCNDILVQPFRDIKPEKVEAVAEGIKKVYPEC